MTEILTPQQAVDGLSVIERLERLEKKQATPQKLKLDDLPIADLQRRLETSWSPEGGVLLQPGSVLEDSLAAGANGLAKGSFRAYRAAALALATTAPVVFDTEEVDVSSWFDVTTGRYTPRVSGEFAFRWMLNANLAAAQYMIAILHKNGAIHKWGQPCLQVAGPGAASVGSASAAANGTTDFFEVALYHNTGGALALVVGAPTCYFQGNLIGRN